MSDEIKIRFTAEDTVTTAVKKIVKALGETELGQAVTAASTAFLAVKEAVGLVRDGIELVVNQFDKAIDAASEMETTNRKLALALASTGELTEKSFNGIVAWSDQVEAATGLGNEYAISLAILAKNMGQSAEQAQISAQAALDLAAATGISAEAAVRQLNATLTGNIGRLGQMLPALTTLTKAQLQNGEAIKMVAQQYDGFAAKSAQTFDGATKRLSASISNVYEAFGRIIVQNPAVIKAIESTANVIGELAKMVDEFANLVLNNIDTIKNYAIAFGIAATAVAGYVIATNAATIATTAMTVATIAFNTALRLTPFGLILLAVGALTLAIGYLIDNFDKVSAVVREVLGAAIQYAVGMLQNMLIVTTEVVRFFDKDLAASMEKTLESWKAYGKSMEEAGKASRKQIDEQEKASKATVDASNAAAMAMKGLENQTVSTAQSAKLIANEYAKALGKAEAAFDAVKDLTPRLQLEKFKQDAAIYEANLKELKAKAEAMKIQIQTQMGPPSAADLAQIKEIEAKISESEQAIKALRIKTRQETREAELKEVQIQLQTERDRTISLIDEIKLKRIAAAQEVRNTLIQLETERLLEERGLADVNARAGVDVRTQAQLNANQIELQAYKAHLEAQQQLAVDMETQKQLALAEVKNSALSGLGGKTGAGAKADQTVAQEQARQQQLEMMRQQEILSEQEYNDAITQSRLNQIAARNQAEIELNNQRAEALGLTEEGLAARQEQANLEFQMKMETLQAQHEQQMLSEAEFKQAQLDAEQEKNARLSEINQKYTQDEIRRHELTGNSWKATLARIRLEQQKHGAMLGTIRGIQASEEYKATNQMLTDLGSLRNSKSKQAFEIGKKAAIVQATINTFMSATAAYAALAGIPIVGPFLATAAAAAALAAGFVQIQNINSQQFNPGGQADEGMDEVPKSMSGRSFILSGGERVLQPEANKEVTEAARTINQGGGGINASFQITINGNPDASQISQLKETIVDSLRELSERGVPIISDKGIVRS